MSSDKLSLSVLFGSGIAYPPLPKVLETLGEVNVVAQTNDPKEFLGGQHPMEVDAIIVYLDGDPVPPVWLGELTQTHPLSSVLVCAEKSEPEYLIRAMQLGVREFIPLPLVRADLEAALKRVRLTRKKAPADYANFSKTVVVTGSKSGLGVTSVAVNLAATMVGRLSEHVALVDLGRPFPDIGNLLDQDVLYTISDIVKNVTELDQTYFEKIIQPFDENLSILHGIPDFKDQQAITVECLNRIFTLLRASNQWIIVDLGHFLDEVYVKVLKEADQVLFLTRVSVPDLRNLKKMLPLLQEADLGLKRIHFLVSHYEKRCALGIAELEKLIQKPVLAALPNDYHSLQEASDQGEILANVAPKSKLLSTLKILAQQLADLANNGNPTYKGSQRSRRFPLVKERIKRWLG